MLRIRGRPRDAAPGADGVGHRRRSRRGRPAPDGLVRLLQPHLRAGHAGRDRQVLPPRARAAGRRDRMMRIDPGGDEGRDMVALEKLSARSREPAQMSELLDTGWRSVCAAYRVGEPYLRVVRVRFGDSELLAPYTHAGPFAAGWAIPLAWDSSLEGLPSGYSDSLRRAVDGTALSWNSRPR